MECISVNFSIGCFFYSYRKVNTVTSTTFTPVGKGLRLQWIPSPVTLDDREIRKFSIGLFFCPYRKVSEKSVIDCHPLPKGHVPSGLSDGWPAEFPPNTHWRETAQVVHLSEKKLSSTFRRSQGAVLVYGFEKKVSSFPTAHEPSKWSTFSRDFYLHYPLEVFSGFERKILNISSFAILLRRGSRFDEARIILSLSTHWTEIAALV